jgi:hypothetical protein
VTALPSARHPDDATAHDAAGLLLARLTVAPVLLATAFLLASFPLLLIGWFRPVPVIALSIIVAAVIVPAGLRRVPGLRPGTKLAADSRLWALPGDPDQREARRTPWWTVASLLAIAVAFFAFQAAYHSQFILISRDPGSYMQFSIWISGHGSLPIATNSAAFGGAKGIWFQGFAMYQIGDSITPQFMAGLPMALAAAHWLGGINASLLMAPFFGAVAIVVFGGLAARLLGARWAPLAALIMAVSLPQMFTSRSTYSEPLAQILFLGGLALVLDSLRASHAAPPPRARWDLARAGSDRVLALLAGLALGITLLVRLDGPSDVLPLIPCLGLLLVRRQPQAKPMIIGLVIGWVWGAVDGVVLSWPYVFQTNVHSTIPMLAALALVTVVTVGGVLWLRRRRDSGRGLPQLGQHWYLPGWLPRAGVLAPFVVLAVFGARSHFQPDYAAKDFAQLSLHWVYWYLGGPVLALATVGAAALTYGCLRGRWPSWALPLITFAWSVLVFLYKPAITPDQPWASRRLVPAVEPAFILLALWTVAWACGLLRRGEVPGMARLGRLGAWVGGKRRALIAAGVASVCAIAFVVPTAISTLGLSVRHGGPAGVKLVAHGLAFKKTYVGQVAAIYGLCQRIHSVGPSASVVIIDAPMADRIAEVVRGMCGVPVARYHYTGNVYKFPAAPTALVKETITSIEAIGRRPVLLAAKPSELVPYKSGGTVTKALTMKSTMDGRTLLTKPYNIAPENMNIWMWEPTR